ncbi:hypothetical protein KKD04_00020 [Patescibacteria group bacterium]|nr:hypothetical protein [Patescibacteria group bacterium]
MKILKLSNTFISKIIFFVFVFVLFLLCGMYIYGDVIGLCGGGCLPDGSGHTICYAASQCISEWIKWFLPIDFIISLILIWLIPKKIKDKIVIIIKAAIIFFAILIGLIILGKILFGIDLQQKQRHLCDYSGCAAQYWTSKFNWWLFLIYSLISSISSFAVIKIMRKKWREMIARTAVDNQK